MAFALTSARIRDLGGGVLAPDFIDVQVNGGGQTWIDGAL